MNYFNLDVEPLIKVKETKETNSVMDELKENMEQKEILEIKFSKVNKMGDLYTWMNGVTIIMENPECVFLGKDGNRYETRKKHIKLQQTYQVIVIKIDEENMTVYVSHAQASRIIRRHILHRIQKQLKINKKVNIPDEEKEKIILPATVVKILKDMNSVYINIYGYGIAGIVEAKEWSYSYIKDISDYANIGDRIDIEILGYRLKREDSLSEARGMYVCSRKEVMEDPWKGIEEKYTRGDIVNIKIIKKKEFLSLGYVVGDENINVVCVKKHNDLRIVQGSTYQGVVLYAAEEKRKFKVKLFKEIEEK